MPTSGSSVVLLGLSLLVAYWPGSENAVIWSKVVSHLNADHMITLGFERYRYRVSSIGRYQWYRAVSILGRYLHCTRTRYWSPGTAGNCRQAATAARRLITIYMVRADGRPSRGGVVLIPCAAELFVRRRRPP